MHSLKIIFATAVIGSIIPTASAFEVNLKTNLSDQQFRKACVSMSQAEGIQNGAALCQRLELSKMLPDVETKMYDKLSEANDNLPDHDYVIAKEGGASAHQLKAMRQNLSDTYASGVWLSPSQGRYLNLQGLRDIRIDYDLVRADFGVQRQTKTYTFYTMGVFNGREKTAKYRIDRMSVDYHFRYTVKAGEQIIYDGFIEHPDDFSVSHNCIDAPGSTERRGCDEALGKELNVGVTNWNWAADTLAGFLLVRPDSIFKDLEAHSGGSTLKVENFIKPNIPNAMPFIAVRSDLDSYARSFQLVEGGKARFAFNQLNLYVAAQRNAPVASGGSGAGAARYLADQQDCIAKARSDMMARRSDRAAAGFLLGMAGLGEAAAVVNQASGIAGMWEGLSSEERAMANSCIEERGHVGGIEGAIGSQNTGPTYVPYTAGTASGPQPAARAPVQGSAAGVLSGSPQGPSGISAPAPPVPSSAVLPSSQVAGEAAQPQRVSGSASALVSGLVTSDTNREAQPLSRVPPTFPPRFLQGEHSGYCRLSYDVAATGLVTNVEVLVCTSRVLRQASIDSAMQWRYSPRIVDGKPVAQSGIVSKIRFDLQDANGRKLPLPEGF